MIDREIMVALGVGMFFGVFLYIGAGEAGRAARSGEWQSVMIYGVIWLGGLVAWIVLRMAQGG